MIKELTLSNSDSHNEQWDEYWQKQKVSSDLYGKIASFYRRRIITPSVNKTLSKIISPVDLVLHAGSGSGEIDVLLPSEWKIVAIDFSSEAIQRHRRTFSSQHRVSTSLQADLFLLPFNDGQFKACFNLGVMEHFNDEEVVQALKEMRRVLSVDGQIILYWPPLWGPTVIVLHSLSWILKILGKSKTQLYPPEINLFRSRKHCRELLQEAGLKPLKFIYGPGDLFTHMVVIARHI